MDRESRSELLKTIDSQQEKIQKYESKLRDLIVAYKGVVTEKDALEATVKAISSAPISSASKPAKQTKTTEKTDEEDDAGESETQDEEEVEEAEEEESEVAQIQGRMTTVTAALTTLTQEKSKLEANFLADKKKIRQEIEEKTEELENEKRKSDAIIQQLKNDLQDWKNRLRTQQHEREREHHDQAMMLRELQKLLADERSAKEHLEQQIDDLRQELQDQSQSSGVTGEQYEKMIRDLNQELDSARDQFRLSQEKAAQPSEDFINLQKNIEDMQVSHHMMLKQEEVRSSQTENLMKSKSNESEHQVAALEAKISELSEVMGNYNRLRFQDQQQIQKLRDRISQLEQENTVLAQTTNRAASLDQELGHVEAGANVQIIADKILKLKDLLKATNDMSDRPLDIEVLLRGEMGDPESSHQKCHEEYERLREEFERYKLRAQSVLKSKSAKDSSPHSEIETLKTQVTELKDRLFQLRSDYEEQSSLLSDKEETFRNSLRMLQEKHRDENVNMVAGHKQRLTDIEVDIRRHRERTIAMLAEKDTEIKALSMRLPDHLEAQIITTHRQVSLSSEHSGAGASSEDETGTVSELLQHSSRGDMTLLHFAREQARKEVEIQTLRKQKHGLETGMRELQQSSILKEQRYLEQIDLLKEEIRKYERNISRENANLEYLKNVVYHFIVCTDKVGKQGTLKAISTILQFSPKEKDKVQRELNRGWWNYVQTQANTRI